MYQVPGMSSEHSGNSENTVTSENLICKSEIDLPISQM